MRFEAMAESLEFPADFKVIVDFAVKDNAAVAISGMDRLVPGGQVDDFLKGCNERKEAGREDSLLVRAAMEERVRGFTNAARRWRPVFIGEAGNSAQSAMPSFTEKFDNANLGPKHPEFTRRNHNAVTATS